MSTKNEVVMGSPAFHLRNVLSLTIITGVMTFFLLSVYHFTYVPPNPLADVEKMLGTDVEKYTIVQDNLLKDELLVLSAEDQTRLQSYFDTPEIGRFYVSDKVTGEAVMTIVATSSGGFGGAVHALVGTDGKEVLALMVTSADTETAGLGQRIAEKSFLRQFINRTPDQLPKDRMDWTPKDIDMISGATFSSTAIVNIIYKGFDLYNVGGL